MGIFIQENASDYVCYSLNVLTDWGGVMHICVSTLTIIVSDNGLSPGRRQAIIRTSAGILLIGTLGTNISEILIEIHTFSFKENFKISSGNWRPFCLGLNVLRVSAPLVKASLQHTSLTDTPDNLGNKSPQPTGYQAIMDPNIAANSLLSHQTEFPPRMISTSFITFSFKMNDKEDEINRIIRTNSNISS